MARLRRLLMTCLLAAALPLHASGEPTASSRDAAAGGLAFVPDPTIVIETQEIVLSTGEIKINYSLRNKGTAERTIMAVFPLPDLDTAQVSDQQLKVYTTQSANFIAAAITVDGAAAPVEVEQRALALGLDVTTLLATHQIPLMPFDKGSTNQLRRLPKVVRSDFLQRGILRVDDERVEPNWTLKTTAYWRQSFPPKKPVSIALTYKPVTASALYQATLIDTFRTTHCLDSTLEAAITRKIAAQSGKVIFNWLTYAPGLAASLSGAARQFKLRIEKSDIGTIVATCRQGFRPLGPTTLEWIAQDYSLEEDVHVLFIE